MYKRIGEKTSKSITKEYKITRVTFAAMCLALCYLLPFLTGNIPQFGNMLCPMHIPVLLCGMLCGWQYGLAVGFAAPLLRCALVGTPSLMPVGISMAFELAAYGLVIGILYSLMKKNLINVYVSLVAAMVSGRLVWGLVRYILARMTGASFTMEMYLSGALLTAIPGIIVQLMLLPAVIVGLRRAKLIE